MPTPNNDVKPKIISVSHEFMTKIVADIDCVTKLLANNSAFEKSSVQARLILRPLRERLQSTLTSKVE